MEQEESLDELVIKYINGDENSFSSLYEATHKSIYYTIYSIVKNDSEVVDLVQETYIRIHLKINQYQLGTSFKAWANTIARNITFNYLKKAKKELVYSSLDEDILPKYELTYEVDNKLAYVLNNLKDDERKLYEYLVLDGRSVKEVAEELNVSLNRVYYLKGLMEEKVKKIIKNY